MLHLYLVTLLNLQKVNQKSNKFANDIFNLLLLGLFFLVILVEIFMPAFISLIAPGFVKNSEKLNLLFT